MGDKPSNKIISFDDEMLKAAKKVKEISLGCQANIVSIFYKNSELLYNHQLKLEDFSDNTWRVYWQIAYDIVIKEQKPSLDEITVGLYLEKHEKLKKKYEEYGGYETIVKAKEYVNESNLEGYIQDLHKWGAVLQLIKNGFPVYNRLSEFSDMPLEEIYSEYDAKLNHVFINADKEMKSYSMSYKIHELIEELDEGFAIGLPFDNMPILTKETGGDSLGNITLIGALSNVGKSSLIRATKIPSILKYNEKLVIMLNEEGLKKWQRELLAFAANNIFKEDLQKYIIRDGKYSKEVKELLHKCADWIVEKDKDHTITFIPFEQYQTAKAIKVIRKYASMGVKYFVLDTFKADADNRPTDQQWIAMQNAMVRIYDTIKSTAKNVHITITFQLSKTSARQRYYTQENIGLAKNIVDVASTGIMIRNLFDDEMPTGKNELKVFRLEGKNKKSKIPVKLDPEKHYQIIFLIKNREGSAGQYQIVCEHDMSRNILKEVGICSVMMDW